MAVDLTLEQQEAIDTRDVSVALSAGAGCGKTHVLTERFISHLDPDVAEDGEVARLSQLIAITFTDAAAREMRSRIRQACYARLTGERDHRKQEHWHRLLRELDTARVSTIHAFCTSLLRANAAEAGLDPNFDVLEQGEADVLRLEVMDDVLRARLEDKDDDVLDLAGAFGLSRLKEQIAVLLGRRHEPAFREWLAPTPEDLAEKSGRMLAEWKERNEGEGFRNCVGEIAREGNVDEILEMLEGVEPINPLFQDAKENLLKLLPKLKLGQIGPEEVGQICLYARARAADKKAICTVKDWGGDKQASSRYSELCKNLRDCVERHKVLPWNEDAAREVAELGLKLLRLAGAVADEYQRRKGAQGRLDFDDQLDLAHRLLTDDKNASLREEISGDLRLLLVDEFQDTDPLQIELVKLVCGKGFDEGRLFFVGDFKQSIYRFRGAQPPEFLRLRKEVPESGQLPLTHNFRSQPGILDFVNAQFCEAFDGYEQLRPHREAAGNGANVEFLWKITPEKNAGHAGARELAHRQEAVAVARRLRELVNPGCEETPVVDKKTGKARRAKPGDIAILFRALSDVRLYEEALRDQGLDYYLVGGHAFYAQQEIYDVLNLLRAVSSAADEVSLAGVLRSPFFALADETLFWLVDAAGSLNAGLLAERLPPELSPDEHAKAEAAAGTIRHLRAVKDGIPIASLLNEALDRTGYDAVLLGEFLGERKLANLQKLVEQARTADGGNLDLNGFITQLSEFIARPPQEPLASTCPETANVIRLMTIHRAKGLEFPLVVVPDLDRPPNLQRPKVALDKQLGPLVPLPSDDDREESATGMSLFAAREKVEELEERKRLFYVACTRAASYLILSSSIESYEKPKTDAWTDFIAQRFDLASGELLATLPDGYAAPRIHIATETDLEKGSGGRSRGADILKMLEEAHRLAAEGQAVVPRREVDPIPVDRTARRQFSVSRLGGKLVRNDAAAAPVAETGPEERLEAAVDPRGFGTLVHDVLARIDFAEPAAVAEWCEHLAPLHVVLNAEEAARSSRELVERFVASPPGRQLAKAGELHREVDYILAWPPGATNGDGSYIRGFIDCLFQDSEGNWHLADFKTDNIAAADVPRYAERYAMQMYVYAMAAERALGQAPSKLALYFLRPGVEHTFPWNEDARQRATEMVNGAIAELKGSGFGVQG